MKNANQILSELKIDARKFHDGSQSCKCPKCSHTRKKKNARCLKVIIDNEGVRWFCHHCNDFGGEYYDSGKEFKTPITRKVLSMSNIRGLRNA
tara:strand:+ start:1483 stop:1761 length:279 start_codon:yes stop_codon:yes gene_type:complete